jgi:NAD dependent epimerase/dehydratase
MSVWTGRRVVVTGAGGFIGSHLAERLVECGARVRTLLHYDSRADRGNLEFVARDKLAAMEIVAGDITDPFFVQELVRGAHTVFHLAALIPIPYSYRAPASYAQTNTIGTLNVCQACRQAGTPRLVHTSTSETYGTARTTPISEAHPLQAQSPYAASKVGADKFVESFHLAYGAPFATIRPFNTYGPRQSARAVIPSILAQLLAGRPELRLGSLTPVRDFLYVADTVEGFLAVAEADACIGHVTNVGAGLGTTIGEVARLAMEICGRTVPIRTDEQRVRPEASEVMALICDASAARQRCGWTPKIALRDGLGRVAEFVRAHPERFRPEEYAV